ncbi:Pumilio y domain member 6 [Rhizina undulata]
MAATKRKQEKSHATDRKKPKVSKDAESRKSKKIPAPKRKEKSADELDVEGDEEVEGEGAEDGFGGFGDEEDMEVDEKGSKESGNNANGEAKTTKSKDAHAEQKRLANERKLAKPNADVLTRGKRIWEQLRRRTVAADERKKLIEELSKLIKNRVKDLVFKHDASRIIQTALKYGDKETKSEIAKELKGTHVALAQSSYGKYLVVKMMHYGTPEVKEMIVKEFYGHVRKLIKHREASFVIEDAFREYATPAQKAALLCEFYGVEFAIFKDANNEGLALSEILEKTPEKRTVIMKSLYDLIAGVVDKGAIFFTILHKAMLEYLLNVKPGSTEVTEFIELVKEHVGEIAFTKDGTQVVIRCLALGTAKDRKVMIKALKPVVARLAANETGFLVLLTIFEVVDDTVLVTKTLIPEIQQNLIDLAVNKFGRIPLLYPFAGRRPRLLPPSALPSLQEVDKIRESTSKKDPETRQSQLRSGFSSMMIQSVAEHAEALAQDSFGCQFIVEVLLGATAGDKTEALARIAELAGGDPGEKEHVVATAFGGRMLKTLVAGGHYNSKEKKVEVVSPPVNFHNLLATQIKPQIAAWATGAGSFVMVGLLEAEGFEARDALLKDLKKNIKAIKAAAEAGNKGSNVILKALE